VQVLRAQYDTLFANSHWNTSRRFSLPPLPLSTASGIPVSVPSELLGDAPILRRRRARSVRQCPDRGGAVGLLSVIGVREREGLKVFKPYDFAPVSQAAYGRSGLSAVGTIFDGGERRALTDQAPDHPMIFKGRLLCESVLTLDSNR